MAGPSLAEAPPALAASGWRVAAARHRGEAHLRRAERGQDALCIRQRGGLLVAALADGAGSAPQGGAGAALAARAVAAAALDGLDGWGVAGLDAATVERWAMDARALVALTAAARGLCARDFAATLVLAVSDGAATAVAHVGDGAAVARGADGAWRALSWPEGGEHAGSTFFLTDETPALRVAVTHEPVTALALFTDGIERLALDFAAGRPHPPFFDRMIAPLERAQGAGRDRRLSRALGGWLAGEAVAARTDDDRTLLLAVPEGLR